MSPGLAGWVVKENPWGLGSGGEASASCRDHPSRSIVETAASERATPKGLSSPPRI